MTTPSYTTDLNDITLADDNPALYEFTGYDAGGSPSAEDNVFPIQGSFCYVANQSKKTGLQSIGMDYGSGITIAAGECIFMWQVLLAGGGINTFANGGYRILAGNDVANFKAWNTGGNDFARNPYGGWQCSVVDPTFTEDDSLGSQTIWQYFGSGVNMTAAISKGDLHGMDAARYGRGEVIIEYGEAADYGAFVGIAAENDDTAKRWGLFQAEGIGYLWKGLLSFGNSTNACDFRDSNVNVTIEDTPRTYAAFNRIEISNADSRVDWTGVNFTALNPSGLSIGQLEMLDNATVNLINCAFTDMSTFIFQSNAVLNTVTFRRCGQVTQGDADIDDCIFDNSTAAVALLVSDLNLIDNCAFASDGTGHAMELTAAHAGNSYTLTGCTYTGYASSDGDTGNEVIYNNSGGAVTITIDGGDLPTVMDEPGSSTTLVSGAVTVQVTVKTATGAIVENARVLVAAADDAGPFPFEEVVTIVNSGTLATVAHTGHGMLTNDKVVISGASHEENNGVFTITRNDDNEYEYTMSGAPGSSPTGTIIATFAALYGLSNASGIVSTSRVYSSDQNVTGWARKGSASPFFKTGPISETVDSADGMTTTAILIGDE